MKKLWMLCRRCAAYIVRENNSLFDILMLLTMVRLVDQHRYMDAAITLLVGAFIAVMLKSAAGKLNDTEVVVQVDDRLNTAGFGRRVQEKLNGRR